MSEERTHFKRVDYEVVGSEVLVVDGEQVDTLHVRHTSASSGGTRGRGTTDIWILPGTPLVVQRVVDTTSVSRSRIGDVEYHEEYRVQLISLFPDR